MACAASGSLVSPAQWSVSQCEKDHGCFLTPTEAQRVGSSLCIPVAATAEIEEKPYVFASVKKSDRGALTDVIGNKGMGSSAAGEDLIDLGLSGVGPEVDVEGVRERCAFGGICRGS